eukprot:4532813-Pleurochrysis_carterae.AAC.2
MRCAIVFAVFSNLSEASISDSASLETPRPHGSFLHFSRKHDVAGIDFGDGTGLPRGSFSVSFWMRVDGSYYPSEPVINVNALWSNLYTATVAPYRLSDRPNEPQRLSAKVHIGNNFQDIVVDFSPVPPNPQNRSATETTRGYEAWADWTFVCVTYARETDTVAVYYNGTRVGIKSDGRTSLDTYPELGYFGTRQSFSDAAAGVEWWSLSLFGDTR